MQRLGLESKATGTKLRFIGVVPLSCRVGENYSLYAVDTLSRGISASSD
jgi:hypothetical protein